MKEKRTCQFCGINADARIRSCCAAGRKDDLEILAAKALKAFPPVDIQEPAKTEGNSTTPIGKPSGKSK